MYGATEAKNQKQVFQAHVCMYVLEKKISADLFFGFKSHAPLKCWFQLSIQRASSTSAAYQVHTHASIFCWFSYSLYHFNHISLQLVDFTKSYISASDL